MLQDNLRSLKNHYTDLYHILMMEKELGECQLEKVNGYYNIAVNGKFIHSRYNPIVEASRWVEGLNIKEEEDSIFIIGLGLGYYLEFLLERYPNKKIIIVEPSKEIFLHFLEVQDATSYIENINIVFLVEKESNTIRTLFDHYIQNNKVKRVFYTELPVYKKMYNSYIDNIYDDVKKILLLLQGNLSTEICFSRRWLYNTLKNFKYVSSYNNIVSLENSFCDIPIVIVSSGPSLEKNMCFLKELYNRALIIAVGTAASILDSNGIVPHIIMGVDGNPSESTIFKKLSNHNPLFVYAHMIHFESLEVYSGDKMWMHLQGDHKLESIIEGLDLKYPSIVTGGSIANTALTFSHWLKAKTILLIGQDLAYTNQKLYAAGNAHEGQEELAEQGYILEKDIYGNPVYTKSAFLTFRNWFEDYVKIRIGDEDIGLFNCTEGGLNIEGIPNLTFKEAIERYCTTTFNINDRIKEALEKNNTIPCDIVQSKSEEYKEQIKACLELSKERLEKIIEILNEETYEEENYTVVIDEILNITSEIEEIEFYKIFIESTGKMYYEAITREINRVLDDEKEEGKKRKIILEGLLKQYHFAHDNLLVAKAGIEELDIKGLF